MTTALTLLKLDSMISLMYSALMLVSPMTLLTMYFTNVPTGTTTTFTKEDGTIETVTDTTSVDQMLLLIQSWGATLLGVSWGMYLCLWKSDSAMTLVLQARSVMWGTLTWVVWKNITLYTETMFLQAMFMCVLMTMTTTYYGWVQSTTKTVRNCWTTTHNCTSENYNPIPPVNTPSTLSPNPMMKMD